jgi:hypothetical protein
MTHENDACKNHIQWFHCTTSAAEGTAKPVQSAQTLKLLTAEVTVTTGVTALCS